MMNSIPKPITHPFGINKISQQETKLVYPIDSFPPLFKDVITALQYETQIPTELIGQTILAAASLASQSVINCLPYPHQKPEPCALYFLTIAESGEGKTTIHKLIMKPFYDFKAQMKKEYDNDFNVYKNAYDVWKIEKKVLESNFRQALKKGYSGESERESINHHQVKEPKKPRKINLIYDDTTSKALIEGLMQDPEAGVISDEAMTFFNGYLKKNIPLLNKAWDGETYPINRIDEEESEINACLTISLMAQPKIFHDYLKKQGDIAKGSGFLSRFLYSSVISTQGNRNYSLNEQASNHTNMVLNKFYNRIEFLLKYQKKIKNNHNYVKDTVKANQSAMNEWINIKNQLEALTRKSDIWKDIREHISKAGSNIFRLAAILKLFKDEENDFTLTAIDIQNAYNIVFWNLNQSTYLFNPSLSQEQLELDCMELLHWIQNRMQRNNNQPFLKNDILTHGPRRLRNKEIIESLLKIITTHTYIRIIQSVNGGPLYITTIKLPEEFLITPINTGMNPVLYQIVPA